MMRTNQARRQQARKQEWAMINSVLLADPGQAAPARHAARPHQLPSSSSTPSSPLSLLPRDRSTAPAPNVRNDIREEHADRRLDPERLVLIRPMSGDGEVIDVTEAMISAIAYTIWERYQGDAQLNWLEAELLLQDLLNRRDPASVQTHVQPHVRLRYAADITGTRPSY
jgi:hypothetical protein